MKSSNTEQKQLANNNNDKDDKRKGNNVQSVAYDSIQTEKTNFPISAYRTNNKERAK